MTILYVAFLVLWVIALLLVYNNIRLDRERDIDKNKFPNKFSNLLYQLSFSIPFAFFVEDDNNLTPKGQAILDRLKLVDYDKKYTVRSYMTTKVLLLMLGLMLATIVVLVMKYAAPVAKYLLNIQIEQSPLKITTIVMVYAIFLLLALMPEILLRFRVRKTLYADTKDIPVLQIFIILMLRANKTIPDILYSLSKLNTSHKPYFELGYRKYLRNQQEGVRYLKGRFAKTRFYETFSVLEDINSYARDDCIRILEGNLENIVDETTMIKRRNDVSKLIYTQASMIVPFITLLLLGAVPIVILGLSIMSGGGVGLFGLGR